MRITLAAILGFCLLSTPEARAQYPNPYQTTQPRVSPYLNLLRGGQNAGLNYVNLVRPEIEFRNSIQNLQTQTLGNQQAITGLETSSVPTTGHAFGFQNHMAYFNNLSTGGVGTGGPVSTGLGTIPGMTRPTGPVPPTTGVPKSGKR
jgi:hypothetical protein